jgi:hypothetical protein
MNKRNMKTKATFIITLLLIFLFAYTGSSKLLDGKAFAAVLEQVPFIARGAGIIAILLPLAELSIALLLLFTGTRLAGLYASLLLLSVFTVYLVYMVLFVPDLPCSCGGVISKMSWRQHVVFNAVFVVLTVIGVRNVKRETETSNVKRQT